MNSIDGSIIVGNPSTPCAGMGCCDLLASTENGLTIPVLATSSGGEDFSIFLSTEAMNNITENHPNMARAITDGSFQFDGTALPFYIDASISSHLWPDGPTTNLLGAPDDRCNVIKQEGNDELPDGFLIRFPQIAKRYNADLAGGPGIIQTIGLTIGSWRIGVDGWGNLVVTNQQNIVMFGKNGNVSVNRRSIATDSTMVTVGEMYQTGITIGDWTLGVANFSGWSDGESAIVFTNSTNVVAFPQSSPVLMIDNRSADLGPEFPISLTSGNNEHRMGDIFFFENETGDLIMRTGSDDSIFAFGAVDGLYLNGHKFLTT